MRDRSSYRPIMSRMRGSIQGVSPTSSPDAQAHEQAHEPRTRPGAQRQGHPQVRPQPPLDIKLTSQPLDTSILDLKGQVHAQTRAPVEKLKILHNKKPVPDSKVLKELLGDADTSVEFTLMVMGGAAAIPPPEEESSSRPLVVAPTGADALETSLFWQDLKGFLSQRLKDDAEAEKLSTLFKSSWESSKAGP
uniref:Ubiquitin-like domain-containing protein n=1 Tax=Bionectria ochroleuca TaxID=29856 RepID=A0A8H7NKT7_BIOOC